MNEVSIVPAILATTEEEYRKKLEKVTSAPEFEGGWIQIDLMDNKFVQNKSVAPEIVGKYKTSLKKEAHLMVDYPDNWIDELIKVGVKRIVVPVEDGKGLEDTLSHIKNHGIEVGLALNPETEVAKVSPFVGKIDVVLILSVHPGFGGQEFIQGSLKKVKEALRLRSKTKSEFLIEVDGGIDETNVKEVISAGADTVVIGSHLIDGDITENIEKIWESVYSAGQLQQ